MKSNHTEYSKPISLWHATASTTSHTTVLENNIDSDVVVIGAGVTGLSTALHLAEQGVKVCVLEAEEPGWGASGRNGGQIIPGLKFDPDQLEDKLGSYSKPVIKLASEAADVVFNLIDKYQINCDPVRKGWIQTAHSVKMMQQMEQRARQWERRGVNVELLDRKAVANRTGTNKFVGGWVDYRAGSVQPLSYTLGILQAAQQLGVSVYSKSAAEKIEKSGGKWCVTTNNGSTVTANRIVIGTNGYTDKLWPKLKQTILAANSYIVATKPLPEDIGETILKGGEVSSDSRRLLVYFRRDNTGRFILGGRGPFRNPQSVSEWKHVERAVDLMFPQLKNIEYEYRWAGRVAVTVDFLPHVHEPQPGIHVVLGYNGRGLAMATNMGAELAKHIASDGFIPLPYPVSGIKPIPLHRLQGLYMSAGVAWYRLLDAVF